MTNDQLKTAAAESVKRLRRAGDGNFAIKVLAEIYGDGTEDDLFEWLDIDRWRLAETYLAQHHADDDEPVTEEWLAELAKQYGGRSCDQPVMVTLELGTGFDLLLTQEIGNTCRAVIRYMLTMPSGSTYCDAVIISYYDNRRQVRQLMEALQIPTTKAGK